MPLMRRQSLVKFDAPLCETIAETPKPAAREVLVRIETSGLCHTGEREAQSQDQQ